jgi:hypothetical protein
LKKKKHKYNLNDKLEFKFFDGDVMIGLVTKLTYEKTGHDTYNYSKPTYTISMKKNYGSKERMWHYPCIGKDRILCKLN